jgi:hypothetical protein
MPDSFRDISFDNQEPGNGMLFSRSGRVETGGSAAVFYILLRDGLLVPGELERVLSDVEQAVHGGGESGFRLSNGWLGEYARDIARRLDVL